MLQICRILNNFVFLSTRAQAPLVTRADVDPPAKPIQAKPSLDTSANSSSGQAEVAVAAKGGTNGGATAGPKLGNGGSTHSGHPEYGGSRPQSEVRAIIFIVFSGHKDVLKYRYLHCC